MVLVMNFNPELLLGHQAFRFWDFEFIDMFCENYKILLNYFWEYGKFYLHT